MGLGRSWRPNFFRQVCVPLKPHYAPPPRKIGHPLPRRDTRSASLNPNPVLSTPLRIPPPHQHPVHGVRGPPPRGLLLPHSRRGDARLLRRRLMRCVYTPHRPPSARVLADPRPGSPSGCCVMVHRVSSYHMTRMPTSIFCFIRIRTSISCSIFAKNWLLVFVLFSRDISPRFSVCVQEL